MNFPDRSDVLQYLEGLASGTLTPEQASDWARSFVVADSIHPDGWYDPPMWEALKDLLAADLRTSLETYLHGPLDFADWLHSYQDATNS